ncbi:MAG: hypothetical protein WC821_00800 [archaeon]|jgi:hypothetical protein
MKRPNLVRRVNLSTKSSLEKRISKIPMERQVSMERAFGEGMHHSVLSVALHVGVPKAQARAYLLHLIRTNKLPKTNKFVQRLKTKAPVRRTKV